VKIAVIPKFCVMVTSMLYKGAAIQAQTASETMKPIATVVKVSMADSRRDWVIVQ